MNLGTVVDQRVYLNLEKNQLDGSEVCNKWVGVGAD